MIGTGLSLGETDVFVAGGGPAGLATAIAARQAGFTVVLADMARPPIDKTCGEGIMPDGLSALQQLGVTIPSAQTIPFHGIRFADSSAAVEAGFCRGSGLGIRRTTLHQILVDKAREQGVNMIWGRRITEIARDRTSLDGNYIRFRWLVGADGQNSRVRQWSGLQSFKRTIRRRYGFRRHYRLAPWSEFVEVHWTQCGQIYVTPVGPQEVCIALVTRHSRIRMEDAFDELPELGARLRRSSAFTREQGAITSTFSLRKVYRGNVALVGEASGSVDAITGSGLSMAFQQAHALAHALKNADLSRYEAAHVRIERRPRIMGELMLVLDRRPSLRHRALRALAAEPSLFARMLAIHTGSLPPLKFGVQGALLFGWNLVRA